MSLIFYLNSRLQLGIIICEFLSIIDHFLDVLWREPVLVVGDGDLLLVAGALVLSGDLEDAVGINLECDLDLRDSTGSWGDVVEVELAKQMVVLGHGPLAFKHLDGHGVLVIGGGRDDLRLLAWDHSF